MSRMAAASTIWEWSSNNANYGLLQGTTTFSVVVDSNKSDCGMTTCYSLQIVLSNTSINPTDQSSQVLEGLFFDLKSNGSELNNPIGMLSALATGGLLESTGTTIVPGSAGSDICGAGKATQGNARNPLCTIVSKGWEAAYSTGGFTVGGTAYSQHYGIGDAGWGLYIGKDVGNSINGIVPGNGVGIRSPNGSITKNYPFVYGTATFDLYGLTTNNVTISNVRAAYGTAPEATTSAEVFVTGVAGAPEPASLSMVLVAVLGLLWLRRSDLALSDRCSSGGPPEES